LLLKKIKKREREKTGIARETPSGKCQGKRKKRHSSRGKKSQEQSTCLRKIIEKKEKNYRGKIFCKKNKSILTDHERRKKCVVKKINYYQNGKRVVPTLRQGKIGAYGALIKKKKDPTCNLLERVEAGEEGNKKKELLEEKSGQSSPPAPCGWRKKLFSKKKKLLGNHVFEEKR